MENLKMKYFNPAVLIALLFVLFGCSTMKKVGFTGVKPPTTYLKPAWIKDLDPAYETGNLPIGLQTALIHDGIVYAGHNQGFMQAFELDNGRLIWSGDDGSQYHSGAIAYNDQIIYGTQEGRVISRHGVIGAIKYSVDLGSPVESVGTINNGRIYFHLRNHQVMALDVETGKILWGYKRAVPYLTTLQRSSTPIVFNDKVLVGFADGSLVALSAEEGVVLYEVKVSAASKFMDVDNRVTLLGDKLVISANSDFVLMLDPNTGATLRTSNFTTTREPMIRGDQLIFGNFDGELIVADKNLQEMSRSKISNNSITNIVHFKNLYVVTTTGGDVVLVDPQSLKVMETFNLGHSYSAVFGTVVSDGTDMAIISSRNRLYFFK